MVEYNTINAKLSDSELNKLKSAVKNKQGATLRMNARMFSANDLLHELLLITRQTPKLRNAIENTGGFLGSLLSSCSICKKYFSSTRNRCCCFSNRCRNSKENTWFWNNSFNNSK